MILRHTNFPMFSNVGGHFGCHLRFLQLPALSINFIPQSMNYRCGQTFLCIKLHKIMQSFAWFSFILTKVLVKNEEKMTNLAAILKIGIHIWSMELIFCIVCKAYMLFFYIAKFACTILIFKWNRNGFQKFPLSFTIFLFLPQK